jgi:uncharacterized protein (DUF1697 family)
VLYAAFFRNLNLGRPKSPSRLQFEAAFADAGATFAKSFLTNGSMVFSAESAAIANSQLARACKTLRAQCGLEEPAYVRSLRHLSRLVSSAPFAALDLDGIYACCVSFLPQDCRTITLPLASKRRDAEIFHCNGGEAFSLVRKIGASPGSPNLLLEQRLKVAVTTRNWNTVVRMVEKHA